MREKKAFQGPVDFSDWEPVADLAESEDTSDEQEKEPEGYAISGSPDDPDELGTVWAEKPSEEEIDNERLKIALRHQNHEEHFGGDDLAYVSDEEMWSEYRRAVGEEEA